MCSHASDFRGLYVATPKAFSPERLICCHTATPRPNPHLSMSINGGATVSAGWAATQPRRRRTVGHRSGLLRSSHESTTVSPRLKGFGMWRMVARSTSQKNSSPPLTTTEQEAADEVVLESPAHFRIYKSGKIDRLNRPPVLPAGLDEATSVTSKDVILDADTGVSVRLFLPKMQEPSKKIPVVVFFHGGAFFIESAGSETYHNYVNSLAAAAGVLVVSVDYRLAPEHPLPAAYDDSWQGLRWVASHAMARGGGGEAEPWLVEHGYFSRVFLAGVSSGGNIAHYVAARAGEHGGLGLGIRGLLVVHPYFSGASDIGAEATTAKAEKAKGGEFWRFIYPGSPGLDNPLSNPFLDAGGGSAARVAADRVLVCVTEKDSLRDRGAWYYENLKGSGYAGEVELFESMGEGHVFHRIDPRGEKARELQARILSFLRKGGHHGTHRAAPSAEGFP